MHKIGYILSMKTSSINMNIQGINNEILLMDDGNENKQTKRSYGIQRFCSQLRLLLWKIWLVKKRSILGTIFEIALPVALCSLLIIVRNNVEIEEQDPFYGPVFPTYSIQGYTSFAKTLTNKGICGESLTELNKRIGVTPDTPEVRDYLIELERYFNWTIENSIFDIYSIRWFAENPRAIIDIILLLDKNFDTNITETFEANGIDIIDETLLENTADILVILVDQLESTNTSNSTEQINTFINEYQALNVTDFRYNNRTIRYVIDDLGFDIPFIDNISEIIDLDTVIDVDIEGNLTAIQEISRIVNFTEIIEIYEVGLRDPEEALDLAIERYNISITDEELTIIKQIIEVPKRPGCLKDGWAYEGGKVLNKISNKTFQDIFLFFDNPEDMDDYTKSKTHGISPEFPKLIGGIVFNEISNETFDYILRFGRNSVPATKNSVSDKYGFDPLTLIYESFFKYYNSGFLGIQNALDQTYLRILNYDDSIKYKIGLHMFPFDSYSRDLFWEIISSLLPFFMVIAFSYPFCMITKIIVNEKHNRIKTGLNIYGIGTNAYYISYIITYIIIFGLCSIFLTILLSSKIFINTNPFLIFITIFLFGLNMISLAVLLSTFFYEPKLSAVIAWICFLISFLIYGAVERTSNILPKQFICLSGPAAFAISLLQITEYESYNIGIQYSNYYEFNDIRHWKFSYGINFMLFDAIVYLILALYFDAIIPSKYGVKRKWYLPFKWMECGSKNNAIYLDNDGNNDDMDGNEANMVEKVDEKVFGKPLLHIKGLTKKYETNNDDGYIAVNNLSLKLYRNEVFCILGKNGAGKSTFVSMLTSLINITSGDVIMDGNISLVNDPQKFKDKIVFIPQHDLLFPRMTVMEHLIFFGKLNGLYGDKLLSKCNELLSKIGMENRIDYQSNELSGGQKRKLSLLIALISDKDIIILDEITTGMDVYSRRQVLNMIREYKHNKLILMSSHFIDEVEILGDRVAIMDHGKLITCGTTFFIKNKYNIGYSLNVSLLYNCAKEMKDQLLGVIKEKLNDDSVNCIGYHGKEIEFRFNFNCNERIPILLKYIDDNQTDLVIDKYTIQATTLEEVFRMISDENKDEMTENGEEFVEDIKRKSSKSRFSKSNNNNDIELATISLENSEDVIDGKNVEEINIRMHSKRENLFINNIIMVIWKRFKTGKRDWRTCCCGFFIPTLYISLALVLFQIDFWGNQPIYYLNTHDYVSDGMNTTPVPVNVYSEETFTRESAYHNEMFEEIFNTSIHHEYMRYNVTAFPSNITFEEWQNILLDTRFDNNNSARYISLYKNQLIDNNILIVGGNASGFHSIPTAYNLASNYIGKYIANNSAININTGSHPFSRSIEDDLTIDAVNAFLTSIILSQGLCFVAAAIIALLVDERVNGILNQQLISGLNIISYHIGNYIWDLISFLVPTTVCIIAVYASDTKSLANFGTFLVCIMYGFAVLPFTYLLSFVFKSTGTAQGLTLLIYFTSSVIFMIASWVLDFIPDSRINNINESLKFFYRIFPPYLMADSFKGMSVRNIELIYNPTKDIYDWEIISRNLTLMGIEGILYFLLVIIIELINKSNILSKITNIGDYKDDSELKNIDIDDDVLNEKNILNEKLKNNEDKYPIELHGIRKVYNGGWNKKPTVAVKDLYFSVNNGEIFGFLGENGSGKSTTMNTLTGIIKPTKGNAYVNNYSISNQINVRKSIGYSPQTNNVLFPSLTVKEHLYYYARIKGIKGNIDKLCTKLINELNLTEYINKNAKNLSGGNQRKLCIGITYIGDPKIVLLDEPSSGMDVVNKRFIWDFILNNNADNNKSVVITSHSMQEIEILANKVGIMIQGRLVCYGNNNHIKNKFSNGYQFDIKLNGNVNQNRIEYITNKLNYIFGDVILLEQYMNVVRYEISNKYNNISDCFIKMEKIKNDLGINNYSISHTTLEQIFMKLVNNAHNNNNNDVIQSRNQKRGIISRLIGFISSFMSLD